MKYILFWEFCPSDLDKVIEKSVKRTKMREKNPEKYLKTLFPSHSIGGQCKGFSVVEATPEQVRDYVLYSLPELQVNFKPLFESAKMIEDYQK